MTALLTWDGKSDIDPITVNAKQSQAGWQTNSDGKAYIGEGSEEGKIEVPASTTGWEVKAIVDKTGATDAKVEISAKA